MRGVKDRTTRKPVIIGFISRKGGAGKTTLAANVAVALAQSGRTVALLDLDAQASASRWAAAGSGILSKIVGTAPTDVRGLGRLIDGMAVDVIVLDTPPSFAPPSLAAAMLADAVVIPVPPGALDLMALGSTLAVAEEARQQRGGKAPLALLAPNRIAGDRFSRDLGDALRGKGDALLPEVRRRAGYINSALRGLTLVEASPRSVGAQEVRDLAAAILRRVRR